MGGDEFLLVITHVASEYIQSTINRMREEWSGCEFEFGGDAVSITASFGLAGFCGKEAPTFQTLVQRADKALYAAKHSGGNHVMIAKDENGDA